MYRPSTAPDAVPPVEHVVEQPGTRPGAASPGDGSGGDQQNGQRRARRDHRPDPAGQRRGPPEPPGVREQEGLAEARQDEQDGERPEHGAVREETDGGADVDRGQQREDQAQGDAAGGHAEGRLRDAPVPRDPVR